MRVKKSKLLLGLLGIWLVMPSCKEDEATSFTRYYISGLHVADPGTTGTYTLGNMEGEFVWSISNTDLAEIKSSSGTDVEVSFKRSGEVVLTVSDGSKTGTLDITVLSVDASDVNVTYSGTGILSNNSEDTVFMTFGAPLVAVPELTLNGINANDTSAFYRDKDNKAIAAFISSGATLSALKAYKNSSTVYYSIYKAGSSNGQPEARLGSVAISEIYGGDTANSLYIKLPLVDNVAPVGQTKLSEKVANDNTKVSIRVTFNEAMRAVKASIADTLVFVDISGGGVKSITDTLWSTNDPAVWTMDYLTNGGGDGTLTVSIGAIVDLAGNSPVALPDATMQIDNTSPVALGSVSVLPNSRAISIDTEGQWLVLATGADAPTVLSDFTSGGVGDTIFVAEPGIYDVYFISVDEAGNVSDIVSELGITVLE
ncbi:MAG: hypothetical protein ABJF04_12810 [Reichenbachiella sp.]|uniref:hypothetical protein n=1 Tax=Reichenbachiella sp. TaxID=2184521 RepID=UPI0032669212